MAKINKTKHSREWARLTFLRRPFCYHRSPQELRIPALATPRQCFQASIPRHEETDGAKNAQRKKPIRIPSKRNHFERLIKKSCRLHFFFFFFSSVHFFWGGLALGTCLRKCVDIRFPCAHVFCILSDRSELRVRPTGIKVATYPPV